MTKLIRGDSPSKLLETHNRFIKLVADFNSVGKYEYYKAHKRSVSFQYNTIETKTKFFEIAGPRCCICSQRIKDYTNEVTVEHIEPKVHSPEKIFLWSNLISCCLTCNNKRSTNEHNPDLYLDPFNFDLVEYFAFDLDGLVKPNPTMRTEDQLKAKYMIDLYKLNRPDLLRERSRLIIDYMDEGMHVLFSRGDHHHISCLWVFEYLEREL